MKSDLLAMFAVLFLEVMVVSMMRLPKPVNMVPDKTEKVRRDDELDCTDLTSYDRKIETKANEKKRHSHSHLPSVDKTRRKKMMNSAIKKKTQNFKEKWGFDHGYVKTDFSRNHSHLYTSFHQDFLGPNSIVTFPVTENHEEEIGPIRLGNTATLLDQGEQPGQGQTNMNQNHGDDQDPVDLSRHSIRSLIESSGYNSLTLYDDFRRHDSGLSSGIRRLTSSGYESHRRSHTTSGSFSFSNHLQVDIQLDEHHNASITQSDLYQHMDSEDAHHQSVHAICSEDLLDQSVHPSFSEDSHHQSVHPSCSASNFMEDENAEQLMWNCQVDDVNRCSSGEQEIVCIPSLSDESANPFALSPGCSGPVIRTAGSVEYSHECAEECNRTVAIHATESKKIKATETSSSQTTAPSSSRDSNSDCQPSLSSQTTVQSTPYDRRPSQSSQTTAQSTPSDRQPSQSSQTTAQSIPSDRRPSQSSQTTAQYTPSDCRPSQSSQTTAQYTPSDCRPSQSSQTTAQYTPSDCRPSQSSQTTAQSTLSDRRPSQSSQTTAQSTLSDRRPLQSNLHSCQSTREAVRDKSNTPKENTAVETSRQESSTQTEKQLNSVKEGRMKDKEHTDSRGQGSLTDRQAIHRSSSHFGSYNRLHSEQSRNVPELQNQGRCMPVKEQQVPNQAEMRQLPNLCDTHMSSNEIEDVTDDDLFGDGPPHLPVFDLLGLTDEDEEHDGEDNCQCDNDKEEDE